MNGSDTPLLTPAQRDPQHFAAGDKALFGYGRGGIPVVIEDATPDAEWRITISGLYGDPRPGRASRGSLLHRGGDCTVCDAFNEAWTAREAAEKAAYRNDFSDAALQLADHLVDFALVPQSISDDGCGHGDRYILSEDALLPKWLHDALAGAEFSAPEGPWPNWGRTCHPADWPALIGAHPWALVPSIMMLEYNFGASWESIAVAFQMARSTDPAALMDVHLWVSRDGRIEVEPNAIFTRHALPETIAHGIDETLIVGGRDASRLHDDDREDSFFPARSGWMLTG